MPILINQPAWLLLLLPLGCLLFLWKLPTRLLHGIRILLMATVILAMTTPMLRLPIRHGTIIVVADRSLSMPGDASDAHTHTINLLLDKITREDRLGVVSFASTPYPERRPRQGKGEKFSRFTAEVSADASNLYAAIEHALSLIPAGDPGRLLILSDGLWTGSNPSQLASRLIERGIAVDYRMQQRSMAGDVAVLAFEAPDKVLPDEVFKVSAWLRVPVSQEIEFELLRDNVIIAGGRRALGSGDRRLEFYLKAGKPGTLNYALRVKGHLEDPVPENNTARRLIGVEGSKPILLIAPKDKKGKAIESKLAQVLTASGIVTEATSGEGIDWSLPFLSAYSGIVLENVPSQQLGTYAMELIAEWVRRSGTGLLLTGGKSAYAMGGYFKSPLDPIMPVSMELRKEHRKMAVAIQAVLDCSGSMGAVVDGNKMKMDLANLGAAELFNILTPMDEIGVMVVDTAPLIVVPLKPNTTPGADRARTLNTGPGGGGILINVALRAALQELSKSQASTRHIILFTDATDSEQPGDYRTLMSTAKASGITCSVIGLGEATDGDGPMLIDLAKTAGGECYFTEDAMQLPRLFAQDTFVIARSTFIEEPTAIRITGGMTTLTGRPFFDPPKLGGYNLCYLKDGALPSVLSTDEYSAPIVASWQAGLGRVLCYTGQVDGQFTGPIAQWEEYRSMLAGLGRWAAGRAETLPHNMLVTQEIKDDSLLISLFLDPEREESSLENLPEVSLLRQTPGLGITSETVLMRFAESELLTATIPLSGSETLQATVVVRDGTEARSVRLAPVCLPYSPEFRPVEPGKGRDALANLAEMTGGKERIELTGIWSDIPRTPRFFDLTPWLIYVVIGLFLMEIFERRTGLLGTRWRRLINRSHSSATDTSPMSSPQPSSSGHSIGGKELSWWQQRKKARESAKIIHASGIKNMDEKTPSSESSHQLKKPSKENKSSRKSEEGDSSVMMDALAKARERAKRRRGEK